MRTPTKALRGRLLLLVGTAGLVLGLAVWFGLGVQEIDRTRIYTIRYGSDLPLHYRDANGLPAGLAVELVQEAARRTGIRLEWLYAVGDMQVSTDLKVLQTVRADRQLAQHFTAPYLQAESCFLVKADGSHREEKDLRGARISFMDFAVHRESLALILPEMQPVPVASGREALAKLAEGLADAAYLNQYSAAANLLSGGGSLPAIRIFPASLSKRDLAMGATASSGPVADAIRREMRAMGDDGTLASILRRWSYFPNLATDTIGEMAQAQRRFHWLIAGLVGMGLVLSLVAWLAHRSHRQRVALLRAEAAVRDSQQWFRTLFEEAGDAILLLEGDRITDCNRVALGMFGVPTRDGLVGHTPQEFPPGCRRMGAVPRQVPGKRLRRPWRVRRSRSSGSMFARTACPFTPKSASPPC
jgi:ABC-type amino acid transport substrate-binding protein